MRRLRKLRGKGTPKKGEGKRAGKKKWTAARLLPEAAQDSFFGFCAGCAGCCAPWWDAGPESVPLVGTVLCFCADRTLWVGRIPLLLNCVCHWTCVCGSKRAVLISYYHIIMPFCRTAQEEALAADSLTVDGTAQMYRSRHPYFHNKVNVINLQSGAKLCFIAFKDEKSRRGR